MDGRPTFFMYTVFAKEHWISRVDTSNTRCQSSSSSTESPFLENVQRTSWPTGTGAARRVAFMLGRSLHITRLTSRRRPAPARTHSPAPLLLSRLHRAQHRAAAASLFPTECRHRRVRSPPRKRVAQLVSSFAVISSTSSTPPSVQLSLGKGEIAVFFHRRHG